MVGMDLSVSGDNALQRAVARHVIRWYEGRGLMKPPLAHLRLHVGLVASLSDAGCVEEVPAKNGRRFHMMIDKGMDGWRLFVVTLVHEMVHVDQMLTRELELNELTRYRAFWKGRDYTETPYSRQPWERQAYRLEVPLAEEYCSGQGHRIYRAGVCVCET